MRRAERAPTTAHGNINLVPLVDILTSIVFFSLLTYQGSAMAALTAFDLSLPPVVIDRPLNPNERIEDKDLLNLLVTLRIDPDKLVLSHSAQGGVTQEIPGLSDASLDQLQQSMRQIRAQYQENKDITVVPSDEISYDDVIRTLERVKLAGFSNISLASKARATTPARQAGGGR
ncbi:MAG TPA: biopolymer transporter ExbD [Gemmatimonadaceae bacterium]|nr:biopolymer transporter ExbD [Gemmatimonadaceae bacterium]